MASPATFAANDPPPLLHQPEKPLQVAAGLEQKQSEKLQSTAMKNSNYKCEFCELTFRRKDRHDRHRYSHTGVLEFPCTKCEKAYSNRAHLNRHIRANHCVEAKRDTIDCHHATCEMKFSTKQSMERHYEAKHIVGKPYACDECDERFWRKVQLKIHKFKHSGQYPHICEHCSQGFANLKTLREHRCRHLQKCPHCAKEFKWWTELVAHRRLEHPTQYRCPDCSKNFHTKRSLKIHAAIHIADDQREVYECPHEDCPRFYEHRRNLYFHMRSKHKEGKQYVCTEAECGKALATKQKLDFHMKLHQSVAKSSRRMKPPTKAVSVAAKLTAVPPEKVSNDIPQDSSQVAVDRPPTDPTANDNSEANPVFTLDKQHHLDSTSESEVECAMQVTNILAANLDSIRKQISALRSEPSLVHSYVLDTQ